MENKFKFLTKYSLMKKLKNKWFLIANVIVLIIIVGLVNIDQIVSFFGGDFNDDVKIRVVDKVGYYDEIKNNLENVSSYLTDSKVVITREKSADNAKEKIKGKDDILLVINEDKDNVFKVEFITDSYVDTIKYQAIITSLNTAKQNIALKNSNIDQNELAKISKEVSVERSFLNEDKTKDEESSRSILSVLSMVIVLPCFMLIVFLVQMIGAEINEEKSTRGMEIIIGNVSAKAHFFSKVVASNIFVFLQGFLLIVYAGIGLLVRKLTTSGSASLIQDVASQFDLNEIISVIQNGGVIDKLGYIIPLIVILFVLSFLAYSLLAGILASITTNMENFQQLQTPLLVISIIGYYLIFLSAAFPGSLFIKIVACIPLISISLAPSLLLSGEIGISVVIIGIILVALLDYLLIKYGLKIYKVGILNYSETNLWKKMFKAVKEKWLEISLFVFNDTLLKVDCKIN